MSARPLASAPLGSSDGSFVVVESRDDLPTIFRDHGAELLA